MSRISARMAVTSSGDDGLTVMEIIIYVVLSAIVGTIVVSLLVSTLTGQDSVTSVTDASSRGQMSAQGLDRALRNAKAIDASLDDEGNTVLTVLTTLAQPCQLWRVTPSGALQASTGGLSVGTVREWRELAPKVEQIGTTPLFGWTGHRFQYSFAIPTEGHPVNIEGAVMPRGVTGTMGESCS